MIRKLIAVLFCVFTFSLMGVSTAAALDDPATPWNPTNEDCSVDGRIVTGGGKLCSVYDSVRNSVLGFKDAPDPQSPNAGAGDYFPTLRPTQAPDGSPFAPNGPTMFASSGLGGFLTTNFDTPGLSDVTLAASATTTNAAANSIETFSLMTTGGTTMLERYAYNPVDVMTFLAKFADAAGSIIKANVWLPFTGLGLLAATAVALTSSAIHGNTRATLWAVMWSVLVLGVSLLGLTQAVPAATYLQNATRDTVASLASSAPTGRQTGDEVNDNMNSNGVTGSRGVAVTNPYAASNAATDAVVRGVHYTGWCRRMFGTNSGPVADKYCPVMWEAQRYTFVEQARIDADTSEDGTVRKQIDEDKNKTWNTNAEEIKKKYPDVYAYMQGVGNRDTQALLELGFTLVANMFRIFASLLLLMGAVVFVGYLLAFAVATPFVVIARFGEATGRAILGGAMKGFLYAFIGGAASWLFTVWTQIALSPGVSTPWSFVLLLLGTCLFWSFVRPDRKLLSLVTFGGVSGVSKSGKWLGNKALNFLGASMIANHAADKIVEEEEVQHERAENFRKPEGPVYIPRNYGAIGGGSVVHEGVVMDKGSSVVPSGAGPEVYVPEYIEGEVIPDYKGTNVPPTPQNTTSWETANDVEFYVPPIQLDISVDVNSNAKNAGEDDE